MLDAIELATDLCYVSVVTESGIYTEADLRPYQSRLAELKQIITNHSQPEDQEDAARETALTELLMTKWEVCGKWRTAASSLLGLLTFSSHCFLKTACSQNSSDPCPNSLRNSRLCTNV